MSKTQFITGLDQSQIDTSSAILRALAHPLRLKILKLLDECKRLSVNEVQQKMDLEQSIASQHLKVLRKGELLVSRREGKFIYYSINYKKLSRFVTIIRAYC